MSERELPYKCPSCGRTDALSVLVSAMAKLFQDPDNYETEIYGDHEWDQTSSMRCRACNHLALARDFENPNY